VCPFAARHCGHERAVHFGADTGLQPIFPHHVLAQRLIEEYLALAGLAADIAGIYTARNFQLVKFGDQPAGLVKLRGEFKDLGLRTQENQLTNAIRRSELNRKI